MIWHPRDLYFRAGHVEIGGPVHLMSGVSREGVQDVLRALWTEIAPSRKPVGEQDDRPWQP